MGAMRSLSIGVVALGLLLLLVAPGPLWASELPIALVSLSSPVAPFTDATIQVQTSPAANCSITVLYKSGPSKAKGPYPQTADGRGRAAWRWRVGSNTTPGRWPIVVRCDKDGDSGELRMSFEVR